MPIIIDKPTAEAIYAALQSVPSSEIAHLREMLAATPTNDYSDDPTYSSEWSEEDLADACHATGRLIEKRFGPESGVYD